MRSLDLHFREREFRVWRGFRTQAVAMRSQSYPIVNHLWLNVLHLSRRVISTSSSQFKQWQAEERCTQRHARIILHSQSQGWHFNRQKAQVERECCGTCLNRSWGSAFLPSESPSESACGPFAASAVTLAPQNCLNRENPVSYSLNPYSCLQILKSPEANL